MKAAVFLDRDGTLIEDAGYVAQPGQVRLLPGAAEAVSQFARAGFRVVLVSNQSGVARGLFSEKELLAVHARLEQLLQQENARLDAFYYCPYLDGPEAVVEAYRRSSPLRKPNPGMLLQAAEEHDVDLSRSWMIGNAPADAEAGRRAGCRTILLTTAAATAEAIEPPPDFRVRSLAQAVQIVERDGAPAPPAEGSHPPGPTDGRSAGELIEIRRLLEQSLRQRLQHDFSLLRLFAALLQMFALVTALWGAFSVLNNDHAAATSRLLLACFLQLASLGAFAVDRFR